MTAILDAYGAKGRGSGRMRTVPRLPLHRGTSRRLAPISPWGVGTAVPVLGCPLGRVQTNPAFGQAAGSVVCCDPINWFARGSGLISVPNEFILALPGIGKSSLVRRQCLYYAHMGVHPLVLGDLKPDYVDLIEGLGGQVISLGRGLGCLNALDMGDAIAVAKTLPAREAKILLEQARTRRQINVEMLINIQRGTPPADFEMSMINRALALLDRRWAQSRRRNLPVLGDVLALVKEAPPELRDIALDRGEMTEYHRVTRPLESTLIALTLPGGLGDVFNRQTTVAMKRDRPAVIDLSAIEESDGKLKAAALVMSWSYGFGQVAASNALADAGMGPQVTYFIVMDELWEALRIGTGMVDRIDALSRLNRSKWGTGDAKISHTITDLEALILEEDRKKAAGLVERSGLVILGGLPESEIPRLRQAVKLTQAEADQITSWSTPATWNRKGKKRPPPGMGKFMIKVKGKPGIPIDVVMTEAELAVGNTNKRWGEFQ